MPTKTKDAEMMRTLAWWNLGGVAFAVTMHFIVPGHCIFGRWGEPFHVVVAAASVWVLAQDRRLS